MKAIVVHSVNHEGTRHGVKDALGCSCVLHLDDLPWKLFVRIMRTHHPVRRGLVVQEFIARTVWEDWNAEIGHGPRPDISSPRTMSFDIGSEEDRYQALSSAEVKYFYWDPQGLRQTVRRALKQHGGFVNRLVLVSLVMVYPTNVRGRPQPFYNLMDEIQLGVVICDMAEVTEELLKPRPWKKVLEDLLSQLPPDHEMAGLTPEEFLDEYQRYYMRKLHDVYVKAKEDQERIKEDQERIKEDQKHIKEDLGELRKKQERMERRLDEIYLLLKTFIQASSDQNIETREENHSK